MIEYETNIANLQSEKANASHGHSVSDITETDSQKVMTAAERTKLSGIAENANNYTHPTSHAANMITGLADVTTSERTIATGFNAYNGTDIEYTATITAITRTKQSNYGKCTVRTQARIQSR